VIHQAYSPPFIRYNNALIRILIFGFIYSTSRLQSQILRFVMEFTDCRTLDNYRHLGEYSIRSIKRHLGIKDFSRMK
jgi:hypothetical protein